MGVGAAFEPQSGETLLIQPHYSAGVYTQLSDAFTLSPQCVTICPIMLKTLSKSLREYKRTSVFAVLLTITEVVFEIIIPSCMAYLIDFGIELSAMGTVFKYGAMLLLFAIIQLLTGVFSSITAAKASAATGKP